MSSASVERQAFVDIARGLSICLVVVMHATLGVGKAMDGAGFMHTLVDFATPFRIPAFFVVAGLFAGASLAAPWPRFFDGKVLHFVYFYVLWAAIQIALKDFAGEGFDGAAILREAALALVEPYGALWFIYLLPIFFVVARLTRAIDPRFMLPLAASLNVVDLHTGWTVIDQFAERFVYFYAGCVLAPAFFHLASLAARAPRSAVAALAIWCVAQAAATGAEEGREMAALFGAPLALGFAGAAALIVFARLVDSSLAGQAFAALGQRSLVVYLAFFLPMAATRILLVRADVIEDVGLVSLIVSIAAIVGPLVLERAVARTPLRFLFVRPRAISVSPSGAHGPAPSMSPVVDKGKAARVARLS